MDLKPGDILFTKNNGFLSRAINEAQEIVEPGDKAIFSHVAIVLDEQGNIFESDRTISRNHISRYKDDYCMLARHRHMSTDGFKEGIKKALKHEGVIYPAHRLFFILCGISKVKLADWPVCSELATQFILNAYCDPQLKLRGESFEGWEGATPDMLEDAVWSGSNWRQVYIGDWWIK